MCARGECRSAAAIGRRVGTYENRTTSGDLARRFGRSGRGLSRPQPSPELLAAARAGDRKAVTTIIAATMWVVRARVRLHSGDPDDLTQIALAGAHAKLGGLVHAIATYDPEKGRGWWSYATTWVDSALSDARKMSRRRPAEYSLDAGVDFQTRPPREDAQGGVRARQVAPIDLLPSSSNPEREADVRQRLGRVRWLPPREREAVTSRAEGVTYAELGQRIGVGRERARVITATALRRLR